MKTSLQVAMSVFIVVFITFLVYWIQVSRATSTETDAMPIYIARPDWYVSNMEWQPNVVLYGGEDYYYSKNSQPK